MRSFSVSATKYRANGVEANGIKHCELCTDHSYNICANDCVFCCCSHDSNVSSSIRTLPYCNNKLLNSFLVKSLTPSFLLLYLSRSHSYSHIKRNSAIYRLISTENPHCSPPLDPPISWLFYPKRLFISINSLVVVRFGYAICALISEMTWWIASQCLHNCFIHFDGDLSYRCNSCVQRNKYVREREGDSEWKRMHYLMEIDAHRTKNRERECDRIMKKKWKVTGSFVIAVVETGRPIQNKKLSIQYRMH